MALKPFTVFQGDCLGAHLVIGQRGSGKSNVGMRKLSWWMLHTERIAVTNLAIRVDPWTKCDVKRVGCQQKL